MTRKPLAETDSREAWLVVIGTIPIVVLGLLLKKHIETTFRGLWVISTMVIVVAVLLQLAEAYAKKRQLKSFEEMGVPDAVAIGVGQCLALIPGSSRSGSTIMAALFRGIDRPTAARYSFLLSIPAVGGAGMLELIHERSHLASLGWTAVIVSIAVAFITGYASIWFLIRYLRTHTTAVFIYYRYVLGAVMIALLLAHRI